MPYSKMPPGVKKAIDTEAKEGGKTKYKGRKQWLAIYHSARKQGKSKSDAAAMAGGGVKKESLSIIPVFEGVITNSPAEWLEKAKPINSPGTTKLVNKKKPVNFSKIKNKSKKTV